MENFETYAVALRNFFLRIAETGGALVLAILIVYLLLGDTAGAYVASVANTTAAFIARITPAAALALAVILTLGYLIRRRD